MRKIFILSFWIFSFASFSQTGMWVWMKGDSTNNSPAGVFGTKNVASPANNPPGLYETCEWKDNAGNLWLFGGVKVSTFNVYNTLWKYDVSSNQWTWVTGSNSSWALPVYGTKGIPGPNNTPGARSYGIQCWTDAAGDFWLFGGAGVDAVGSFGGLSDLWKFNVTTQEWTWMSGPNLIYDPGTYGTMGVSSPSNIPGNRNESNCTWVYNNELWLYGGLEGSTQLPYSDLWKYNITTNEWTWVWGSTAFAVPANFGTIGVASISNNPGGRTSFSKYSDGAGNLYLLGAGPYFSSKIYADVWKYNIPSGLWTWVAGVDSVNSKGLFGSVCNNIGRPAAKSENRACWTYKNGMYVFGGKNIVSSSPSSFFNDLWYFDGVNNTFTWINGSSNVSPYNYGQYGTQGVPAPGNVPSSRIGSSGWTDNSGNLWMFGGFFMDTVGVDSYEGKNDLWKFYPDSECVKSLPTNINQPLVSNDLKIYPNPADKNLFIDISGGNFRNVSMRLMDVLGKEILKSKLDRQVNEIDVGRLSEGIYFIEVWSNNQLLTRNKIIKE